MKKNQPAAYYDETTEPKRAKSAGSLGGMLGKLPATIKSASTTQKIVGGALLAAGITLLTRQKKAAPRSLAATLDELLLFVNDRIEGYERAVSESQDHELRGYYKQLVSQSQQFATDLNTHLAREGGAREQGTTLKGKLYRAFMKAQAAATGHSEKSLLAFNIHGETWALKAYEEALASPVLTGPLRQVVDRQHRLAQQTCERLKKLAEKV